MTWSIVGVSAVVETTTGTLTLSEPAGVVQGDLLVACISARGYNATPFFTPATGWTAVNSVGAANTATTTSAIASGAMAYVVRGASAPSFSFGLSGSASVAIGRVVAYRGNSQLYAPVLVPTAHVRGTAAPGATTTAACRNFTNPTAAVTAATTSVGMAFALSNYGFDQSFLTFNTSAIPVGATSAVLRLNVTTAAAAGATDFLEVREVPSASSSIAGDSLGSFPLLGSAAVLTTVGTLSIPLNIASMTRGSAVILCVHSQKQRTGVAGSGLNESLTISSMSGTVPPSLDANTLVDANTLTTTAAATIAVSVPGLTTTALNDLVVAMIAGGQEAAWSAFNNAGSSTAWSQTDKSANIVLTAADSTATANSGVAGSIRSVSTQPNGTTGKYYAEFLISAATINIVVGIQPTSSPLGGTAKAVYVFSNTGSINYDGTQIGTIGLTFNSGTTDVVCMAWDVAVKRIWFRKNSSNWNNDASANPATGTNGLDISALPSEAIALMFKSGVNASGVTLRNDASECTFAIPAGFSAWGPNLGPLTASGATDTTTAPSTTAWIERADTNTTTGADTSLAVFDSVRSLASATGNLTATASLGAAHVVIAAAFKILPTADAWNVNDKSANISLSNADKTATGTDSAGGGVRSTTTHTNETAGKWYAEFLVAAQPFPLMGITPTSNVVDATTTNFYVTRANGGIWVNNVFTAGASLGTFNAGDVLRVAWDSGAERVWFCKNGGSWNNNGSADPATGSGGLDVSFAAATPHALWGQMSTSTGNVLTIRTELADFTQTVPAGFLSWMGETPPTQDAWNYLDKSVSITLSNGDKTATASTSAVTVQSTQLNTNETAGKYYVEFKIAATHVGNPDRYGIQPGSIATDQVTSSIACSTFDGSIQIAGSGTTPTVGATPVVNDVICMAWDAGAERIWFRLNGGLWLNNASADPATGTNGFDISTVMAAGATALWFYAGFAASSGIVRTRVADLTQTVPSGFVSWMGETPPSIVTATGTATGTATVVAAGTGLVGTTGAAFGTATVTGVSPVASDSGAGQAAGTSSVTATGNALVPASGTALGAGAAVAFPITSAAGSATGSGVGFAIGTGIVTAQGVGASSTSATATGTANLPALATATGTAVAQATGLAIFAGRGDSAGTAALNGVATGITIVPAGGTATGTSTVAAAGNALLPALAAATGTAVIAATGAASAAATGVTTGTSTVAATGNAFVPVAGLAAGTSVVTATGRSTALAAGNVAGTASVNGIGAVFALAAGSSVSGIATVAATSQATVAEPGLAAGTGVAAGAGQAIDAAQGVAAGSAIASASGIVLAVMAGQASGTSEAIGAADLGVTTADLAGTSTVSGVGRSTATASAAVACTSTATGFGNARVPAAGAVASVSTASAIGGSTALAAGVVTAAATASAASNALAPVAGASVDTASVTASGAANAAATGAMAGVSTSVATGGPLASGDGIAAGVAVVAATGQAIGRMTGISAGRSTVVAVSSANVAAAGQSDGLSSVAATGSAFAGFTGGSAGTSTVVATGEAVIPAQGTSLGEARVTAAGHSIVEAFGIVAGVSTAEAEAFVSLAQAVGDAAGYGWALGTGTMVLEAVGFAAGIADATTYGIAGTPSTSDRLAHVAAELRTAAIVADVRAAAMVAETRIAAVAAETRIATVSAFAPPATLAASDGDRVLPIPLAA